MAKRCRHCHSEVESGARFCGSCQTAVGNWAMQPTLLFSALQHKKNRWIAGIALVLILSLLTGFFFFVQHIQNANPIIQKKVPTGITNQLTKIPQAANAQSTLSVPTHASDGKTPVSTASSASPQASTAPNSGGSTPVAVCTAQSVEKIKIVPQGCVFMINSGTGTITANGTTQSWSNGGVIAIDSGSTITALKYSGGKSLTDGSATARDTFCKQVNERKTLLGSLVGVLVQGLSIWKPCDSLL